MRLQEGPANGLLLGANWNSRPVADPRALRFAGSKGDTCEAARIDCPLAMPMSRRPRNASIGNVPLVAQRGRNSVGKVRFG